ncbi:hypothetical protein MUA02_07550 [Enterobacteriaceae bacterium H20N1]|uniref:Uncharacterized protein n=1 Tax=Dryocola boscaweniae TaxID=2925397 RepID=A0A9X3ACC3_9ENTR|nr:hypothetical protein [Dryocola boscaweniae]MCT4701733.1 hypothetical protein [Dryocola boscaweniae]MCT4718902.1 hypothetical protein [Dryocola boscaweniae]
MFKKTTVALLCAAILASVTAFSAEYQFTAENKPATDTTKNKNEAVYK